jgi:hypothetical protein
MHGVCPSMVSGFKILGVACGSLGVGFCINKIMHSWVSLAFLGVGAMLVDAGLCGRIAHNRI